MYKVGMIGCGGRGKSHARGYAACAATTLVACADPVEEKRQAFAAEFGAERPYADYGEMLQKEELDLVSVCTWTGMHREMIEAAASSGIKAIHAEKPMATTWGDAQAIMQACDDNEVVITFCHQRRFGSQWIKARELATSGAIGEVYRYEGSCPNLFDWGTHWFDMFFFYNDDQPAEWVIGQIDGQGTHDVFGAPCEGSGLAWVRYQNGREGLLATGDVALQGVQNRIIGSEGVIEVIGGQDQPPLRVFRQGTWETPELSGVARHPDATICSVFDLVEALDAGREPELSGRKALQATELIFATYESSRRRGKVVLPLDVDDSALIAMLESGEVER